MSKFFSKNINRAIVFLCIVAVLTAACFHIFSFSDREKTDTMMNDFYALSEDSAECIFFGSSITQRAFVAPVAYHEYGVSSYIIGSSSQPLAMVRYLMEESLKTQTPKVFIVELKGVCKGPHDLEDVAIRKSVDVMKQSVNRFRAIRAVTKYAATGENDVDKSGLTYYIPFFKYHYLWNPSKRPHKYGDIDYYNGYSPNLGITFNIWKLKTVKYDEHVLPIDENMEAVLNDLLDYCDTLENTKVLFVEHPIEGTEDKLGMVNYARKIVEKRGYECLNFMSPETRAEAGLNDKTDYYNREHLNYYGSLKYTKYVSEYIIKNYGVEDRRGDPACEIWDKEYKRLSDDLTGKYAENYNRMMDEIKKTEEGN